MAGRAANHSRGGPSQSVQSARTVREMPMRLTFVLLLITATASPACAQEAYPTRQVTLIAPYAAGGSTDLVGRVLSDGLKAKFNQPVTVDNRPGGNGVIGTREV